MYMYVTKTYKYTLKLIKPYPKHHTQNYIILNTCSAHKLHNLVTCINYSLTVDIQ